MVSTDKVQFGKLRELRYLPKKIANFHHEFRADDFNSLGLPPSLLYLLIVAAWTLASTPCCCSWTLRSCSDASR